MAADSLLAALQSNYGTGDTVVDDVNTVRGLLSFCKKWPEGLVRAEALNNPCLAMAAQLREAAAQLEPDLQDNPEMAQEMREPIARTMEGYLAIADALEELPEFARDNNVNDFVDNIGAFEEERQAILDAQDKIQLQLSGNVRLCPRCGSSGEASDCETCFLTRLYPDPKPASIPPGQNVQGLYGKVFRAYHRAISGDHSLQVLWGALELLEEHLESLLSTRKQFTKRLDSGDLSGQRQVEAEITETLLAAAEKQVALALKGIERMKTAQESFQVLDLSRGWEDIYHAAQAIEVTATRIRRELEDEDEEEESEDEAPPRNSGDQISFSQE